MPRPAATLSSGTESPPLKDSLKALLRDAADSMRDLLPIVVVVAVFQLFVIRQPVDNIMSLLVGAVLVLLIVKVIRRS